MSTILLFSIPGLVLSVAIMLAIGLIQRPRFICNYEEAEFGPFGEPTNIVDGFAIYVLGDGEPVLLIPYPHGHTTAPMSEGPLSKILAGMGRRVITFDVPGAYRSTRKATVDIDEMIACAVEALEVSGIREPVDVVGHSMGGLVALGLALERPELVDRLVLVGTFSGFRSAIRNGMPGSCFDFWKAEYWKLIIWGLRVQVGWADLAMHKRLQNLMEEASFHDKSFFSSLEIEPGDKYSGVPVRMKWSRINSRLTYAERLGEIKAETLVIAGRHDPEAPLTCSEELSAGIRRSQLIVFEESGHHPFIEEEGTFIRVLNEFLGR